MSYKLKEIGYLTRRVHILLQNENGPCPLLAAANCLLLKDKIQLSPLSKDHGFITLDDLINMLAEFAVSRSTGPSSSFHMDELLKHLPRFQYGMDVNPHFHSTTGYEYTAELTAFDMLGVSLVHGWVVDPTSEHAAALGNLSYNQVTDYILQGQTTAMTERTELESRLATLLITEEATADSVAEREQLQTAIDAHGATIERSRQMEAFLAESSHQLTLTGLSQLLTATPQDELYVFFRNNHYGVITKHGDALFLLITDLGYGESDSVVWERLDMVDGDTELCNAQFQARRPLSQQPARTNNTTPVDTDFEMALQLSAAQAQHGTDAIALGVPVMASSSPQQQQQQQQEAADRLLALQLQDQTAPAPARTVISNDVGLNRTGAGGRRPATTTTTTPSVKDCVVM